MVTARISDWPVLLWAFLCTTAYVLLSWLRWDRLTPTSWDNAIFEQAVRGYAHFGWPIVDIKGPGYNLLGDHFSPLLAVLAPFYRLWPTGRMLLVAQAVLIGISIIVISRLAIKHLGGLVGGLVSVFYGVNFGFQSAVAADFHEVALGVPLLALAGAAFVDRKSAQVIVWSLPLLFVKEDLGLTIAMIGLALWLTGERRRGSFLALAGLIGAALILAVIIPLFNPDGTYAYSANVGGQQGLWATLFDQVGRKIVTVAVTFGVTGFAALASPWALLVIPTFAWRFVGDVPYYWGTDWHYSLLLMPIIFVAMIDAAKRFPQLRWATVPAAVFTAFMLWQGPLMTLTEPDMWHAKPRETTAAKVMAMVPSGASVETDIGLITHLTSDRQVYWAGTIGDAVPEFVLVDYRTWPGAPFDLVEYAEKQHGGTYTLLFEQDDYALVQRDSSPP